MNTPYFVQTCRSVTVQLKGISASTPANVREAILQKAKTLKADCTNPTLPSFQRMLDQYRNFN